MCDEPPTTCCGIYTRQSRRPKVDFSSCEAQFAECKRLVWGHVGDGWAWNGRRYDDEGHTGESLDRPAFQRLLADVEAGEVQRVVVHRLDRLSRSLRDCTQILQILRDRGVPLTIVTAPDLDATAEHTFVLNILASFAEFEREMIRSRLAESRASLKAHGLRVAGNVPYGYRADPVTRQLVLDPVEARRVRAMFVAGSDGHTSREIAEDANRRKWSTASGSRWTARQVLATLTNAVYAGRIQNGDGTSRGVHEAIVDEQLFAHVGALIESRRSREPGRRPSAMKWPLRGQLYCGRCGRLMSPSTSKQKDVVYRYYRCRSDAGGRPPCRSVTIPAFEVEKFVLDTVADEQSWQAAAHGPFELRDKLQALYSALPLLDELAREALLFRLVQRVDFDATAATIQVTFDAEALEAARFCVA